MSLALLPKDAFAQSETEEPLSNFWKKKKVKTKIGGLLKSKT
jgi:hypothetical protein